ncbi:MAG: transcriptional regulator [Bacteroidia bacterium]|nr:transcriptional regulator [Bacteroidia bacterium]
MWNKNILTQSRSRSRSSDILNYFNKIEQHYFDYEEAKKVLPTSSESALKELLSDMVKRGLLMRLKKGLYYLIPYNQDSETFMPDWHLLAEPLAKGTQHYIGYYSALQIHDLITQPSLKEQIVVAKQLKPAQIDIKGVTFQFIYHNQEHFFGAKKVWIDSFNKVLCSDLEKTFIDCLFKPDYAGGIVEVAKAIYMSQKKIKYNQLFDYTIKFNSQAVIKRLGFLLELLEINTEIIEKLQVKKTHSYVLLDTELPKQGKRSIRWSIRQNLELETIKSAIFT